MEKNIFDKAGDLLNKSVGDDGLKTDVKVTLSNDTYVNIGLSIFIPGFLLIVLFFVIRGLVPATVKVAK